MKNHKDYYVNILASQRNGTLYVGVTNDLIRRVYEHKHDLIPGFTKTYKVHNLVHYKQTTEIESAIKREKQIKWWLRQWKINLIEETNPEWNDLFEELV
jgi:putative endonuclease